MDTLKSSLLEAAFSGREDKLLKSLKKLQSQSKPLSNPLITECIEYSIKHSNSEISTISTQILSHNQSIQKQNGHSLNGHSSKTSKNSSTSNNKPPPTPPQTPAVTSSSNGSTQTKKKKKNKPSYTQRMVDEIDSKITNCLSDTIKLNESLVFSIIDFLYKSLKSCELGASFEKIVFKSKYVNVVFGGLNKIMSQSLLDFELFDKKCGINNNNLSLHDILKDFINKNISISDKVNGELYQQLMGNIKEEMKLIKDQPEIVKIMEIRNDIDEYLKQEKYQKIGTILINLYDDVCKYKKIKISKNILERSKGSGTKGLYECLKNLKGLNDKFVVKKAKAILTEFDPIMNPSNNTKSNSKRGKKRVRERGESDIIKSTDSKRDSKRSNESDKEPPKKRQRTKGGGDLIPKSMGKRDRNSTTSSSSSSGERKRRINKSSSSRVKQ